MKRLEGKVSIITGAAQGLGEALAIRLGQEGAKVVVADMNYEGAQKVAAQLPEAIAVPLNVCDPAQCDAMAKKAEETYGRVDLLVSNAAILISNALEEIRESRKSFQAVVNPQQPKPSPIIEDI